MNLSDLKQKLVGKKIQFTEDLIYCSKEDLEKGRVDSLKVNNEWLGDVKYSQLNDKIKILELTGFIKDGNLIIPKELIGKVTYAGVNESGILSFENGIEFDIFLPFLVTTAEELNDETILVKIVEE